MARAAALSAYLAVDLSGDREFQLTGPSAPHHRPQPARSTLPAGFDNSRNLTLESKATEAQTADAKLAQKRARPAAELAAVVLT